jgi:hypothetical protein
MCSIRLDIAVADDLAPFFGLGGHKSSKFRWLVRAGLHGELSKPLFHGGIPKHVVKSGIELRDDSRRRPGWNEDTIPFVGLEPSQCVGHRRQVGKCGKSTATRVR